MLKLRKYWSDTIPNILLVDSPQWSYKVSPKEIMLTYGNRTFGFVAAPTTLRSI